ncbi:MAG: hypothetical protein ACFE8E_11330 [Candidatus Hodarchaeota archaeon]
MPMEDNWGTISFLIFYLAFIWIFLALAIIKGLRSHTLNQKSSVWKWTFLSYFFLAFGDVFHLGFRIFLFLAEVPLESELFKLLLGIGYVVTGVTMTYFYIALLHAWSKLYGEKYSSPSKIKLYLGISYVAFITRIILILLPYNHWFDYIPPLDFGFDFRIITSIPLYVIGFITVGLLFKDSKAEKNEFTGINININKANYMASIWFIVSFACYSITLFGVVYISLLGLFMIPKTVAYLVALYYHYKYLLKF